MKRTENNLVRRVSAFSKTLVAAGVMATLTACGGGGGGSSKETVAPPPANAKPQAVAGTFELLEDNSLSGQLQATDGNGDSLTFHLVDNVAQGQLQLSGDGSFVFTPAVNFNGEERFSFKVNDGKEDSSAATVTLSVSPVNDAPEQADLQIASRGSQPVILALPMTDVDGDKLTVNIESQGSKGQASVNAEGQLVYIPTADSRGLDSFTLTLSDGELSTRVTVTVDNDLAYRGQVTGVDSFDDVDVLLTANGVLERATPDARGEFKFYGLSDGDYAVKIRKPGYRAAPARVFSLGGEAPAGNKAAKSGDDAFELEALEDGVYSYHWQEDQSTAGNEYSASINTPVTVTFLEQQVAVIDDAAANKLQHDFNILLANEGGDWSQEHAYRLNETFKSIPQNKRDPYKVQSLKASKWVLTNEFIADDIEIVDNNGQKTVRLSTAVFVNASPKLAEVDGRRGIYYSQRLHHALVRFVTNNGADRAAVEKILSERYGVSLQVDDYPALTAESTGGEGAGRFQEFHPEELVQIINMFEEMPRGMHKLSELKYLVRRLDGTPHPLYPSAPAVAWPTLANGYIEFMESAFKTSDVQHMHRLILHEKAHFLWQHQFDARLKADWIALGGWYEEPSDPDGWATTRQTEFVSAYAHQKNPNEDMAESVSYFVINPDKLKSRAPAKYDFVRDRIMQGNIYLSTIRDDLTFQVYNLYPDYVFPGKIKRVDIKVAGAPDADKTVTVELELHALDKVLEGARLAKTRIFSEAGTYVDLQLDPIDAEGNHLAENEVGTVLRGSFELSKHAKAGYWRTEQITITDAVGNERFEGANDFGWKLYIDNADEDLTAPQYVAGSAGLGKSASQVEGREVQLIEARWQVDEAVAMAADQACYATLNDELPTTYSVEKYGNYDAASKECRIDFVMPDYMPSGSYEMNYVEMRDEALNIRGVYFTDPGHGLRDEQQVEDELPQSVALTTANPDTTRPELDVNDIQVTAVPSNPDSPNGETLVTVTFKVRDDISGYNIANLNLRDPQGIDHNFWAYNKGTYSLFPQEDPSQWQTYSRTIVLPAGSAPGTWGLSQMTIHDRAGNFRGYDFTEIVHFDVID